LLWQENMTTFPGSPRLVKGGLALLDPETSAIQRIITLQYNPETLSRTLQIQGMGAESGDRLEALRLKGPPVETIKIDAEIDATDQLEFPDQNPTVTQSGIYPHLAALETIVYPTSGKLQQDIALSASGTMEIISAESPLLLFIWSKNRVLPVRLTEFSITEEMFDPALNPIRAKVSLGMRVLSVNDLPATHRGASLYLAYQQQKERLAAQHPGGVLNALGLQSLP
jgi:hypothetical protein